MTGQALILRGDARALPLPDASVDLIVTSPPFYALRSYTDGGEHYVGQIGSEATPGEYIAALIDCTREWMRVLKPTGSLFVDLGDSYYSGKGAPGKTTVDRKSEARTVRRKGGNPLDGPSFGIGRKSLLLLPERYRIAAVDQLGLIARAVIVWHKPNGLPESVTDRVRRSHEDYVHLVKQPRYYSAVDEIREPHANPGKNYGPNGAGVTALRARDASLPRSATGAYEGPNPLGKLPGSVWSIPSEPLKVPDHLGVDHYAAFPSAWPRRIILGWSPPGICVECGEGLRPVSTRQLRTDRGGRKANVRGPHREGVAVHDDSSSLGRELVVSIVGYACACPTTDAPTRPSVVLDPFGGTGTTALAATALGRIGITVDRSGDYCRLAQWRVSDPGQMAKVLGVPKPPAQVDGQLDLFGVTP